MNYNNCTKFWENVHVCVCVCSCAVDVLANGYDHSLVIANHSNSKDECGCGVTLFLHCSENFLNAHTRTRFRESIICICMLRADKQFYEPNCTRAPDTLGAGHHRNPASYPFLPNPIRTASLKVALVYKC